MEELKIDKKLYNNIAKEANKSNVEICGLGFDTDGDGIVDEIKFSMNISMIPGAEYQFSPEDFYEFISYHRGTKTDKKLIMVFHSHPLWKAFPSGKDIEKAYPNYIYLIYSNVENLARAFKVDKASMKGKKIMYEIPMEVC